MNFNLLPSDKALLQLYARLYNKMEFIKYIKSYFDVKHLCRFLNINRNRYYYLRRTNQLTLALGHLYDYLQGGFDYEQSQ